MTKNTHHVCGRVVLNGVGEEMLPLGPGIVSNISYMTTTDEDFVWGSNMTDGVILSRMKLPKNF